MGEWKGTQKKKGCRVTSLLPVSIKILRRVPINKECSRQKYFKREEQTGFRLERTTNWKDVHYWKYTSIDSAMTGRLLFSLYYDRLRKHI